MAQKRKLVRRHLLYYLEVLDRDTGRPLGRLANLSPAGLMLLCPTPLTLGRIYRLRVLPPEGEPDEAALDLTAECLWSRRDVNPELFVAGFRSVDADAQTLGAIERLVRNYGFSDGQPLADED